MQRVRKELVDRRAFDDLRSVHDRDMVGHLGDHAEVMRDEQNRHARLGLKLAQQVEDLSLDRDIERGRRFVGDKSFGEQASAMAIITRCRMPPENWWG